MYPARSLASDVTKANQAHDLAAKLAELHRVGHCGPLAAHCRGSRDRGTWLAPGLTRRPCSQRSHPRHLSYAGIARHWYPPAAQTAVYREQMSALGTVYSGVLDELQERDLIATRRSAVLLR